MLAQAGRARRGRRRLGAPSRPLPERTSRGAGASAQHLPIHCTSKTKRQLIIPTRDVGQHLDHLVQYRLQILISQLLAAALQGGEDEKGNSQGRQTVLHCS